MYPGVVLVEGVPGVGKGTLLRGIEKVHNEKYPGGKFEDKYTVVSFSGKLVGSLNTKDRDAIRRMLKSPQDALTYQQKVYDEIFTEVETPKVVLVDTHSSVWYPLAEQWGDGLPTEVVDRHGPFECCYKPFAIALVEPESITSLETQRAGDNSRDRRGFPEIRKSLIEEKRRAISSAFYADCFDYTAPRFEIFKNRFGKVRETAQDLFGFVENIYKCVEYGKNFKP